MTTVWTKADQAELDVLLDELVRGHWEHREKCRACRPCPETERWREHKRECRICDGMAPLSFGWECSVKDAYFAHLDECPAHLPCPSVAKAIDIVLDWRFARALRSTAAFLRARVEPDEWDAAA